MPAGDNDALGAWAKFKKLATASAVAPTLAPSTSVAAEAVTGEPDNPAIQEVRPRQGVAGPLLTGDPDHDDSNHGSGH